VRNGREIRERQQIVTKKNSPFWGTGGANVFIVAVGTCLILVPENGEVLPEG